MKNLYNENVKFLLFIINYLRGEIQTKEGCTRSNDNNGDTNIFTL